MSITSTHSTRCHSPARYATRSLARDATIMLSLPSRRKPLGGMCLSKIRRHRTSRFQLGAQAALGDRTFAVPTHPHMARQRSNHAVERTATRFAFTFRVATNFSAQAALALGGR